MLLKKRIEPIIIHSVKKHPPTPLIWAQILENATLGKFPSNQRNSEIIIENNKKKMVKGNQLSYKYSPSDAFRQISFFWEAGVFWVDKGLLSIIYLIKLRTPSLLEPTKLHQAEHWSLFLPFTITKNSCKHKKPDVFLSFIQCLCLCVCQLL